MTKRPQKVWKSEFGEAYTERKAQSVQELNNIYNDRFGKTQTELNREFLDQIDRDIRILEVGSSIGTILQSLKELGFQNLYGIDIQPKAVERAHAESPELNIIEGDALDIPFKDDYFDLVLTSCVLIHIPPEEIDQAIQEITRCATDYVYGYEYYADEYTEITYRQKENILWKANFPKLYEEHSDFSIVKEQKLRYDGNIDTVFLLEQTE